MFQLDDWSRRLLEARYLRRDEHGRVCERPEQLVERVASAVSEGERRLGSDAPEHWREVFAELLAEGHFLPNSPTLMHAGTDLGQLSGCFVVPIGDSLESIFDAAKAMALIQRTGGGTGFDFSSLRPRGSPLARTGGRSSGPVAFLRLFDSIATALREGGRRRGANMAVLDARHPDVFDFLRAKRESGALENFNLSVGLSDAFMEALAESEEFAAVDPQTGAVSRVVPARALFDELCQSAWACGDPGVVFLDALERGNPTPGLGRIVATNPCGEVPLLPWESCNLGSIHLGHLVREAASGPEFDFERLRERARVAVRFLDDVIEVNRYPSPEFERAARATRKVGLGVMGFAEALVRLDIAYDSEAALAMARRIAGTLAEAAHEASLELAEDRGPFPASGSRDVAPELRARRNATTTSIAPTGTISRLVGTTPGIEPIFALAERRPGLEPGEFETRVDPLARNWIEQRGLDPAPLAHRGSITDVPGVDEHGRHLFAIAHEIAPEQHIAVQVAFQAHVDNAVSKTVNLPESATPETVARIYRLAFEGGSKGITVFRAGSTRSSLLERGLGGAGVV